MGADSVVQPTAQPGAHTAAIIGTGLIGQGWAIVFARQGWQVRLHDVNATMLAEARALILQQLRELEAQGLLTD
ncbi:MAG: 3-hydroxyacyl-CoA dehydrogenase NAD-binding domain-containing protein, partial [Alcaligenes sp.]